MSSKRFHMSLPCQDVNKTSKFYEDELGFDIGRKSYYWVDINLLGNQITFTLDDNFTLKTKHYAFEEVLLPSFHFGILLDEETWTKYYSKFKGKDYFAMGAVKFLEYKKGQHQSFFIEDVNGYFIEFKNFTNQEQIFENND